MKSKKNLLKFFKGIGIAIALPVAVLIIMEILIGLFADGHVISSMLDFKNMVRGAGISAAIAFGLSMNLTSGRMDLSLGSQRVVATIVGGIVASKLGLGGAWVLLFAIIFGLIFGGIVGFLYVTLRIPPMVLGIGVACIYECIGFGLTDGVGLRLVGTKGVEILSNVNFTLDNISRAVRGAQQIAKNAGINVFVNVAICYTVAGILVAISGVLDAAFAGSMTASMGLTSNGVVMQHMFPMMIGGTFLSRYVNQSIGIISAAVAVKILGMGLTCFNLSDATSGVVNMAIFIAFLVYQANAYKIKQAKTDKLRIAEAKAYKAANGLA